MTNTTNTASNNNNTAAAEVKTGEKVKTPMISKLQQAKEFVKKNGFVIGCGTVATVCAGAALYMASKDENAKEVLIEYGIDYAIGAGVAGTFATVTAPKGQRIRSAVYAGAVGGLAAGLCGQIHKNFIGGKVSVEMPNTVGG